MMAAGHLVGVLGIPESAGPFSEVRQGILAAVATLLGISIRNAELFREVRDNSLRDGLTQPGGLTRARTGANGRATSDRVCRQQRIGGGR